MSRGRQESESRRVAAFDLLGIPVGSSREDVLRAYRRLARATHPDVSADAEAADRFANLTAAYRLLSELPAEVDAEVGADVGRGAGVDAGSAPGGSGGGSSSPLSEGVRLGSWQRPPIIAGPVRFRRFPSSDRRELREG